MRSLIHEKVIFRSKIFRFKIARLGENESEYDKPQAIIEIPQQQVVAPEMVLPPNPQMPPKPDPKLVMEMKNAMKNESFESIDLMDYDSEQNEEAEYI